MSILRRVYWVVVATSLLLLNQVNADTDMEYNLYSLQAQAEAELANDLMVVQLAVEGENRDSTKLANMINSSMSWALQQMQTYPEVDANTSNYRTHPRYNKGRIDGWHASQTLILESGNFEQVKQALSILQQKLQIKSMSFKAASESRQVLENNLIEKALAAFRERADIIRLAMQAQSYEIVEVSINTGSNIPRPVIQGRAMSMAAEDVSAPAIEAGMSTISVQAHGKIQLR